MKTHLLLGIAAMLAAPAMAAVVQTTGSGSAAPTTSYVTYAADFEGNTSTVSPWSEGGLSFTETNAITAGGNGGCGYAGVDCVMPGTPYSEAFSGNYFATAGTNAYLTIRSTLTTLQGIEFAVDSGYLSINLLWQTYLDGVMTGSGKAALGTGGIGAVLGLSDLALGFDEVRLYAFDSPADNSGTSVPAIDSVRGFTVPEPGSLALVVLAGLCAAVLRRSRR